ncbi:metal ABC transporter solute-binding protein, Zn/Mn family [Alienimonas chondri]|uniref:metal ABC transporter solute-binding protein, Zn/Mn family n=1 Tax=Alienimonas chondri TaxID=2681879 RepID=UPI001488AFB8|nr:zinc ABC transporter substrate-binding protein [Alienimonas chondri]
MKSPEPGKPVVVATTGMVADLATHVAGEHVEVVTLMGPGVDPHLYKPTIADVRAIRDADLVLYSGLKLEEGLFRQFEAREKAGAAVAAVTRGIPQHELLTPPDFEGHPDPHVWHDVALWARCLDVVTDELAAIAPQHEETFQRNANGYRWLLQAEDERVRAAIATIPQKRRVLVTAHDAFGYFSRAYDIPVRSVQGVTTESEAGVADVNALAKFLADSGVPAIFAETSVSDRAVKAVVEGANRRGGNVRISPTPLYSDALGARGSDAESYVGTIAANVAAIVTELGGELPEGGLLPAE